MRESSTSLTSDLPERLIDAALQGIARQGDPKKAEIELGIDSKHLMRRALLES